MWGLRFRGPKCAIWGQKFRVGEMIWGLIFLVCDCQCHFLNIKFFFATRQLIIWIFEKFGLIIWGLRKLAEMSTRVPNVKESPSPPSSLHILSDHFHLIFLRLPSLDRCIISFLLSQF